MLKLIGLNSWWQVGLVLPMLLGVAVPVAIANPTLEKQAEPAVVPSQVAIPISAVSQLAVDRLTSADAAIDQVTSVSQLSDVKPTDWAFQALQSLVERYGCIVGYPDKTYRGNRALTRYEFAAGLNACMDRINELIAAGTADLVKREDLLAVQKLQEEFAAELVTLRGRVDALEVRTATLEKQQFSTTTKLNGQVIFAITDAFGGASRNGQNDNYNTTFSDRIRLNFNTSFTGKDLLTTRIQASNVIDPRPATNTAPGNEARLSFQSGSDTSNAAFLSLLKYAFPIGDRVKIYVGTGFNIGFIDVIDDIVNPLANDAQAAISRFGRYSPIYRLGFDTGGAVNIKLGGDFKLQAGYLASEASNPAAGSGLFNGNYAALAQLVYAPQFATIAFTYVNAYSDNGLNHGTGSTLSNLSGRAVSSNSYGVEANFKLSKGFQAGGWVSYMDADARTGAVRGKGNVWSYALTLAFPDLGKKGNLGGIIVGMEPRLTGTDALLSGLTRRSDKDTGLHIEAFYRYSVSENISITPGIVWLTAPNHNSDNDDIVLGVIRTTFSF
ncbi:MAG: iron uptake porin [Stenomitos rutilans HA7619-LM2]|nr:iron uptake porin [Stenomitos rutilans HA7619-LM2]